MAVLSASPGTPLGAALLGTLPGKQWLQRRGQAAAPAGVLLAWHGAGAAFLSLFIT